MHFELLTPRSVSLKFFSSYYLLIRPSEARFACAVMIQVQVHDKSHPSLSKRCMYYNYVFRQGSQYSTHVLLRHMNIWTLQRFTKFVTFAGRCGYISGAYIKTLRYQFLGFLNSIYLNVRILLMFSNSIILISFLYNYLCKISYNVNKYRFGQLDSCGRIYSETFI